MIYDYPIVKGLREFTQNGTHLIRRPHICHTDRPPKVEKVQNSLKRIRQKPEVERFRESNTFCAYLSIYRVSQRGQPNRFAPL